MIRFISLAVGAGFVLALALALFGSVSGLISEPPVETAAEEFYLHPKEVALASNGPLGTYDNRQLQRGLQVYKEVCASCHSLKHVAFRDLTQIGYSAAQVKKFAADWTTKAKDVDPKSGESVERPNTPADYFPTVYYPGQGNPPDLSLITKARHDGPAYVYSLLTGYGEPPAAMLAKYPDAKTPDGLYFNRYFPTLNLAMPPPLAQDGQVTYLDGTKPTVKQMSADVSAFLAWAAEPNLPTRHGYGLAVLAFIAFFTVLTYGAYKNIWRDIKH